MTTTKQTKTPFGFLTAQELRGLATFFAADAAALSVDIDHDGITTTVTRRDVRFIHELDASRFGRVEDCPICIGEMQS